MKLNVKNKAKIQVAINTAQYGCENGLLASKDIDKSITIIERKLCCMLLKSHWIGLEFTVNMHWRQCHGPKQPLPDCTRFKIQRFPSGWFITAIWRGGRQRPGIIVSSSFQGKGEDLAYFMENNFD